LSLLAKRCKLAKKALANVSGELFTWILLICLFSKLWGSCSDKGKVDHCLCLSLHVISFRIRNMGPVGTLEYHNFARTENRKSPSILFSHGLSNKLQRY
jgi:hypothetical protein